ncbi:hypothetical protein Tco_0765804 [Tanacetum coccineum]
MGLWYSKDTDMSLTAYADADHAGCQDTSHSTLGSWYRIFRKGQKQWQNGRNKARDLKERKKSKPKAYTSLMG